ncbi:hypothetical protein SS37A_30640 [Methylocystis iwaonis]|uniref:Uncharacterized protein n=1 Tax=Methylocystis iwaonis TaxID=2885079 RepID=A0ABN6VIN2_9HYPH|nr:hypothetical protein SS37A_30640 [Methylocystis iwaonis]
MFEKRLEQRAGSSGAAAVAPNNGAWIGATKERQFVHDQSLLALGASVSRLDIWIALDLLGEERRKTGWMLAEAAGDSGPWRQQVILGRARWDADALGGIVRDDAPEIPGR